RVRAGRRDRYFYRQASRTGSGWNGRADQREIHCHWRWADSSVIRVGILGGTFHPIHFGHLRSAVEVRECLGLDELRLVPNARPPHRDRPGATAQQRLDMVCLATASDDQLLVDDCELRRERPSYTVE